MTGDSSLWAKVDDDGKLIFPDELIRRYGLVAGVSVRIDEGHHFLRVHRPLTHLAKLYIEPSGQCNLKCRTCVRNLWNEPMGLMSADIFRRIVNDLEELDPPPTVVFGGFGEPTFHPMIAEMVATVKAVGCRTELITNGTLLTLDLSRQFIEAGLDLLWVSLDGASADLYEDVRLGSELKHVIQNVKDFSTARRPATRPVPEIGISFVAMKRNISDLPALIRLSWQLGASRYLVTNLLPYSAEMCSEILYKCAIYDTPFNPSRWVPQVDIPRMDPTKLTNEVRHYLERGAYRLSSIGEEVWSGFNRCPFIERGAAAVAWDGGLSPCLALLHDYDSFLNDRPRHTRRYVVGRLEDQRLQEIWSLPEYCDFRERVQKFDFPPCNICGGCDLLEANEEDCYGNRFPTCGGCLWAQGIIQCP